MFPRFFSNDLSLLLSGSCPPGYNTDGDGSCVDLNECVANNGHGPCQDTCINTEGSFQCTCEVDARERVSRLILDFLHLKLIFRTCLERWCPAMTARPWSFAVRTTGDVATNATQRE